MVTQCPLLAEPASLSGLKFYASREGISISPTAYAKVKPKVAPSARHLTFGFIVVTLYTAPCLS